MRRFLTAIHGVLRNAVSRDKVVVGHYSRVPDRQYGLPYVEDHNHENLLVETTRLFGLKVSSRVIDREDVPMHVAISAGCFGDTAGWTSKFAGVAPFQRGDGTLAPSH